MPRTGLFRTIAAKLGYGTDKEAVKRAKSEFMKAVTAAAKQLRPAYGGNWFDALSVALKKAFEIARAELRIPSPEEIVERAGVRA